jgi:hypothetical protein
MKTNKKTPAPAATGTSVNDNTEAVITNNNTTNSHACQVGAAINITAKKAQKKLSDELSAANLSRRAQVIAEPTLEALNTFCEQNEEFAQAVLQTDKTFAECAENAVKGAGGSLSDIEVYRKAVGFYFKGADVHFNMTIDLGDGSDISEQTARPPVSLSLDSLLDF